MPRDSNGTYTLPEAAFVNGTIADADDINSNFDDIADALTASPNIAGTKAYAADQPMAGFKFTGLGAGTANGHSVRYEQLTALSSVYQPLDADLTAIAALGYTSGSYLIKKTAADTYSLISITANAESLIAAADYAAMRGLLDLEAGTDFLALADAVAIAGTQTVTGAKTFSNATTALSLTSATPRLQANDTDGASNEKLTDVLFTDGDVIFRSRTDADGAGADALTLTRGTGTAWSNITSTVPLLAPAGSASAPAISSTVDSGNNTGLYWSDGQMHLSVTGSNNWSWSGGSMFSTAAVIRVANGTVGSPSHSFQNDTDNGLYYIGTNNWGLAAGGSKIVDIATTGIVVTGTIKGRTETSSEASGTLTSASANTVVKATGGITINDGVFTAGDHIEVYNDSDSSITITQDTGMTLRLAGTTSTGNRTLAARGIAIIYFDTNADATVGGTGVS